ncbi:SCO2322 family protein [Streptomyces sp. NPDC006368]|uniref:SCO2322 family protein n=1 Tax=Streptomyces sp. NPDC006368 TaxID=3156760 RepID=UPI0033BC37B6
MRAVRLLLLGMALTLLASGPAQATGYRYWSFWQSGPGPSWTYATQGPATARPVDGEVNGYRFAVSAGAGSPASQPRRAPDFAAICGTTPREDGTKRVAIVVDFGTAADAPEGSGAPPEQRGACARVPEAATSADALAAVAKPLRYNSQALLCAIAGYPRTGCGEQVADSDVVTAPAPPSAPAGDTGPSLGLVAGAAAVLALGAAALWQASRRRRR